jgi:hypothetical protein
MTHGISPVKVSLCALFAALVVCMTPPSASGQSTAFTFQGQLKSGGAPIAGQFDIRFKLFDAAAGGTQIGTTQCFANTLVTEGVFSTAVDFGPQFTTTAQRFIEVSVRPATGLGCANTTGFSTLSPRQLVSAAPTAIHAKSAFALDSADGSRPNAVFVSNAGSVGVGTTNPLFNFWIGNNNTNANTDVIIDSGQTSPFFSALSFFDRGNNAWGIGKEAAGKFFIAEPNFQSRLTIVPGGKVGINTVTPSTRLDVRGDASFGDTGAFHIFGDGRVTMGNIGTLSQITIAAQDAMFVSGFQPFITLNDTNVHFSTRIQSLNAGMSLQGGNFVQGIPDAFMFLDAAGRLGIHKVPTVDLDVVGTIRCTSVTQTSSAAFKDDVTPLAPGLDELMRLRPVSYVWNDKAPRDSRGKHDLGFIAEEVEKVLPDAVAKDDAGAAVGIDYSRITVLAVKAIKEQQARHEADREEIRSLRERLEKLEAALVKKP